jgi:arginyl-tRNA synthetase
MRSNEAKYAQVEEPEMTSAVIGASAVKIQDMSAKRYVPSSGLY